MSISASPASVSTGGSSQLTWTASNANSCSATGDWAGSRPASGSEQTSGLTQAATYNLSCTGAGGTASASVTVKVSATTSPNDTVTVTASSGSGGGGGGGALGVSQLAMLLGLLWHRQRRRRRERARVGAHTDAYAAGSRTTAAPAAPAVPVTAS
ncbi:MAG: hypothetical protein U1F11_12360 [Steroidobacteraceae bacterium]